MKLKSEKVRFVAERTDEKVRIRETPPSGELPEREGTAIGILQRVHKRQDRPVRMERLKS